MKKTLSLILVLVLAFSAILLVSCSDDEGDEITLENMQTLAEQHYNSLSMSDVTKEGKAEFAEYYRLQLQKLDDATNNEEAKAKLETLISALNTKYKEMFVDSNEYKISAQRAAYKAEIDAFAAQKNINNQNVGETQKGIFDAKVSAEKLKFDSLDSKNAMEAQLTASKNTINVAVQDAVENAGTTPDSPIYLALADAKAAWLSYKDAPAGDAKSLSGMLTEDRTDMESIYNDCLLLICEETNPDMLDSSNADGHVKKLEADLAAFYEENKTSIAIAKEKMFTILAEYFRGERPDGPNDERLDRTLLSDNADAKLVSHYQLQLDYINSRPAENVDSEAELEYLLWETTLSVYNKFVDLLATDEGRVNWTPIS